MPDIIKVAMADDHSMLRQALADLIERFGDYRVILQASNGKELIAQLKADNLPDLVLLDINMPEMDGIATANWLRNNYPEVKVLAVSMMDKEQSIIAMIRSGARGYVLKDAEPAVLREAIGHVLNKGFHYSDLVTGKLIHNLQQQGTETTAKHAGHELSEREIVFLKHTCTELTYKEIADRMHLSPRTIDGYRDSLFEKLGVKTRVGLAMYAVRAGLAEV